MRTISARSLLLVISALVMTSGAYAQQYSITNTPPNGEVSVSYPYPGGNGFQFTTNADYSANWQEIGGTLPPGLTLSSGSGVLGGSEQVPTQAGTYTFTVQATFSCSCSPATATFTVQVFTPISITTSGTLPGGTVGQPYQFQFSAQGGDQEQYSWSIESARARKGPVPSARDEGSVARLQPRATCTTGYGTPPGLCMTTAGVLQGTPTTAGTYNFYVQLYDQDIQNYAYQAETIVISPAVVSGALTLTGPINLGTIVLGNFISGAVIASGGQAPYNFTVTGVPAGMTASGAGVAGTPTAPGNYSVPVSVVDAVGSTAASAINFSVFGISITAFPNGITFSPYSYYIPAVGGTPPYSFAATGVPAGFSFTNAGWLNGTPKVPGNYTLAVTATDSNGLTYSASLTFSVTGPAPLQVPGGALSDTTVLVPNSQSLSATGGAPPYTWSIAGGTFPDGLTLRGSGTISGTPDKTGSYTFSARATDVTGGSGVGTYTINVKPQPIVITTPSPLSTGMNTVDYPIQEFTATGGSGTYAWTVTTNKLPPGLTLDPDGELYGTPTSIGDFIFTVTATDTNGATGTASMEVKVRVYEPDLLLSVGSLSFSMAAGSSGLPGIEEVQVQSTDVTQLLKYSVTVPSAPSWLSVAAPGTSTPGSFIVSLTPAALSLGVTTTPLQAQIVVTCVASSPCGGSAQTVNVQLSVNSTPPELSILSGLLSFTTTPTNPQATTQTIGLENTGGGSIGFANYTCSASWCQVGSGPSSLGGGVEGDLNVTANPSGLQPGFYYADLTIVSSIGTNTVPVSFFIAANSTLALDPDGIELNLTAGGQVEVPETSFTVSVSGTTPVPFTAALLPGAPWLTLGTASGTAAGTAPGSVSYNINETAVSALQPGAYYGTIRVTAPSSVDSPQDFQVVLNVGTTGKTKPDPTPAGLLFVTSATGNPPTQIDQVFASSSAPIEYQASAVTVDGNAWLSVSPTVGFTSVSFPAPAHVSVSPGGLVPGIYHGTVSYSMTASAVRTVNVTLIVLPAGVTPTDKSGALSGKAVAGCTPSQLVPTQTGLVSNFAAPASWPTPLQIKLSDDCGNAIATAQIVTTFSNGDPPLLLTVADPVAALYSGTWTPRHTGAQVTVTAKASATGFPAATAQIAGAVLPNVVPVLTPNGTLNVFTPQVGAPLAPGTIVQIYGSQLANQVLAGTTIPLANTLAGTSVIIGGEQAPLFFVSPGQINAQVPFDLTPGQPYQVIVNNNGAISTPSSIEIGTVAPGVAALPSGVAIAQHVSDATLVTDASPAKPGEYVVLYLAGLGATTVPVANGAASPSSPLAQTQITPTLTLNNESITPLFSGLTPGLAGLYQIDFQVPADAANGDLNLVVSQPGYTGGSVILPVHN